MSSRVRKNLIRDHLLKCFCWSLLLVEDDQVDCMTIKRALEEEKNNNRLDIVSNGEEALAYLLSSENDLPGIIILDLNMPRMNGIELMKTIGLQKIHRRR